VLQISAIFFSTATYLAVSLLSIHPQIPILIMADFVLPRANAPTDDEQRRLKGPIHAEKHIRVICIGAGASGLLCAYKLQRHFQNFELAVYEKNKEVSGTWYENRYPG
jgi:hypothetical protein